MYLRSPFPPMAPLLPTNFHNMLFPEKTRPDYIIHIDAVTGQKRTHSEFLTRVHDAATALSAPKEAGGLGFTPNDMIGILSDNCLDYIVLVHSLLAITTPFALFSSYATPREMAHSLTESRSTHIFVHASLFSQFLPVALKYGLPEGHIYILEGTTKTRLSPPNLEQLIQKVRYSKIPREPVRQAGEDTLAYLVFSSGTSGLPKAVMISHGNLNFSLIQAAEVTKVTNSLPDPNNIPVVLAFLPLWAASGLHFTCLSRCYAQWNHGGPMWPTTHVVMPRWDLNLALSLIPKYHISSLRAIPSIIHQLVHSPLFKKIDISSIRSMSSGAAYLPPKLSEKLKQLLPDNAIVFEGYGLSECTIAATWGPLPGMEGCVENINNSTGFLLPGMEAMILRPDGTHCLPNEPGELYVKGANVALGYWNNPKATKETFIATGWLRTGDHFIADHRGILWFKDRLKDTIKVSGLQVSPAEIEDTLLDMPGGLVTDVAVAAIQTPDARTSDDYSPCAWVVLSEQGRQMGEKKVREALEGWVKANLSKYKWLRGGIHFMKEIPKNPTGKVLRRVLQLQYASDLAMHAKL